jgi:hypothetical protein
MKKSIKGYEGQYSISSDGKVYSDKSNIELKQSIGTTGYYRVNLNNKDGGKTFKVHRLVAIHFIENPNKLNIVNHKDGNKLNNNVENLEWCDYSHNNRHARENGLCVNPKGTDSKHCKKVKRLDTGEVFPSLHEAALACNMLASKTSLSNHLAGRLSHFAGVKWEFVKGVDKAK